MGPLGSHLSEATEKAGRGADRAASNAAERFDPTAAAFAAQQGGDDSVQHIAPQTGLGAGLVGPASGANPNQTPVQPGDQMTIGRGIPGEQGYTENTTLFGGPNGPQLVVPPIEDRLNAYEGSLPPAEAAQFALKRRDAEAQSQRDQFDHFQGYMNSVRKSEADAAHIPRLPNQPAPPTLSDDAIIQNYQKLRKIFGANTPAPQSHIPGMGDINNGPPHAPAPGTKLDATLHPDVVRQFLQAAGGDKEKARQLAKANGWSL
jgi:hypothetical protein